MYVAVFGFLAINEKYDKHVSRAEAEQQTNRIELLTITLLLLDVYSYILLLQVLQVKWLQR